MAIRRGEDGAFVRRASRCSRLLPPRVVDAQRNHHKAASPAMLPTRRPLYSRERVRMALLLFRRLTATGQPESLGGLVGGRNPARKWTNVTTNCVGS
ncbi:hypothetical protein E2C01_031812 [Portunus trituberculatus]|uniref:Uncharacterized protein n=1 Tax=Portunus trituberculatus TaxID=210409 RepID=A0A5B7EYV1_PORTR|nr:hypothetical protein [Portunus trituberculatus]